MLRVYRLQQWYNLSDPGAEEALYDIHSMRAFCGLELGRDAIPRRDTILNFRHLLEWHDLTKAVFVAVAEAPGSARRYSFAAALRGRERLIAEGASPGSTKNREGKIQRIKRRGNRPWLVGVGVDATSGLVHTAGVTTHLHHAVMRCRDADRPKKASVTWAVEGEDR